MDIVACADKRFVMPAGVMMYSVCHNNPDEEIVFHVVLDGGVSRKDRDDLEKTVGAFPRKSVVFYPADGVCLSAYPTVEGRYDITRAAYYRLMLSEILPRTMDKVLYLDGDLIVRGPLRPLWDIDMTGYAVAAVTDSSEGEILFYNRLKYPPQRGYFNSGVMLINLDYWRRHSVLDEFNAFLKDRPGDILYFDQDVLNYVFHDCKLTLPLKYNLSAALLRRNICFDYWKYEKELSEAIKDPVIVHFTREKPWYSYQRRPHPYSSTWHLYQDRTMWKGIRTDHRPLKTRLKNFVSDVKRLTGLTRPDRVFDYIDVAPID